MLDNERVRLDEDARREKNWKRWGPYLSERQWGTVREDYSPYGECWSYLSHDQSRSRAYRWGEDGLFGISDRECRLCFSIALWNGRDPILKERLFGLTGPEGNHGEDVKECYYYLDSTPTHSYMKALYKYPHRAFPYAELVEENRRRGHGDREYELTDTQAFADNRYFDVQVEYAKAAPDDILVRITVNNRGPDPARLHVLPTLWFRNTWSWGRGGEDGYLAEPPRMRRGRGRAGVATIDAHHPTLGQFRLSSSSAAADGAPRLLFTENETNTEHLFGSTNASPFVKDAFHRAVVEGDALAVSPAEEGSKAAAQHILDVDGGSSVVLHCRLVRVDASAESPDGTEPDVIFARRIAEADQFYEHLLAQLPEGETRNVARQAYAGLLWSKQFYHYVVRDWLQGDPAQPSPPDSRLSGRNAEWGHLYNRDIISMPDKWEYPWYAAWDLAFHAIPLSRVDPQFAKEQLLLMLREWYMHPNGQIPAYEFAFGDVNPPVHAWACWRVYKMTGPKGKRDRIFLGRAFQKLLINFTWWVNRKDAEGHNIFGGGFLGMDNIGVFDRSRPLPTGGHLEQADGTAWMAFYCATMLSMALELAQEDPTYEDVASKFFEHFVAITDAINTLGGMGLWDERDGFYYDQLHIDGMHLPLRVRSLVGFIPMLACEIIEQETIDKLPGFRKRMQWFLDNRPELARHTSYMASAREEGHEHRLLAIPSRDRLERLLHYLVDEHEFLSPYGIRSVSRIHHDHPAVFTYGDGEYRVMYEPGESSTGLFGGNSNWRGPIWFPINYLILEALERYDHFYGDELTVEYPARSGERASLGLVARDLARRMSAIFLPDAVGNRPVHAGDGRYRDDPHWRELALFYEYFNGDDGRGVGASHQTGWTALVTRCLETAHRGTESPSTAAPRGEFAGAPR